ncbi:phosphatidylserine/phosphatidylglycerophosphate/cardiolipin synthase family protein [Motiliproteus sp. MSK22-1]|uniref:phospholipase D-like domain-containing protein n=1 Tax=Motiliproteus sp. MSK22-1 TaxID=1897630 RepID=UPI00097569A4|nr:phosphatidylserine/phosphatidylglycerophosphate/cardiolipin synthase family protein [Motiliproteus sp. MSK22-1]OMH25596.1 cardiolipin synthase B [Motiliproteus sp. MSK22-1]
MTKRTRWYWHQGNTSELLIDGQQYFSVMLDAIECAKASVLLEFYFVSSGEVMDRFIAAMSNAASRGVCVRMLIDAVGSRGLSLKDRKRLFEAGVGLRIYNPIKLRKWNRNFARDHRKLLLVDGRVAFIGGTGLADEFLADTKAALPWHEFMLKVEGPVLQDWLRLFQENWFHCTGEALSISTIPDLSEFSRADGDTALEPEPSGEAEMKVATTEGVHQQEIKVDFRRQINAAHTRVWLVTAYFLPSWSIRRALQNAAQRGVDVRLLLPGPLIDHSGIYHAARRYYKRLLVAGVRIYEYQPRFIHAKLGVCDNWVSIGSCNLDHWNLRWNLEANQEVIDTKLTDQVCSAILSDLEQSDEITLEYWQQRPWYQRSWGFVWGYINSLLLRLV